MALPVGDALPAKLKWALAVCLGAPLKIPEKIVFPKPESEPDHKGIRS